MKGEVYFLLDVKACLGLYHTVITRALFQVSFFALERHVTVLIKLYFDSFIFKMGCRSMVVLVMLIEYATAFITSGG